MTREIYEEMKRRVSVLSLEETRVACEEHGFDFESLYPHWDLGTYYRCDVTGLNEGLDEGDPEYLSPFIHQMLTTNMWNVCQRFYRLLRCYTHDIDKRLLQPIYAVVHGDMVVGGPYPNRKLAEADCDTGDEVLEILHTDQGYGEFKAFMK